MQQPLLQHPKMVLPWQVLGEEVEDALVQALQGEEARAANVVVVVVTAVVLFGTLREIHGTLHHDNHQRVDHNDYTAKTLWIGKASLVSSLLS